MTIENNPEYCRETEMFYQGGFVSALQKAIPDLDTSLATGAETVISKMLSLTGKATLRGAVVKDLIVPEGTLRGRKLQKGVISTMHEARERYFDDHAPWNDTLTAVKRGIDVDVRVAFPPGKRNEWVFYLESCGISASDLGDYGNGLMGRLSWELEIKGKRGESLVLDIAELPKNGIEESRCQRLGYGSSVRDWGAVAKLTDSPDGGVMVQIDQQSANIFKKYSDRQISSLRGDLSVYLRVLVNNYIWPGQLDLNGLLVSAATGFSIERDRIPEIQKYLLCYAEAQLAQFIFLGYAHNVFESVVLGEKLRDNKVKHRDFLHACGYDFEGAHINLTRVLMVLALEHGIPIERDLNIFQGIAHNKGGGLKRLIKGLTKLGIIRRWPNNPTEQLMDLLTPVDRVTEV